MSLLPINPIAASPSLFLALQRISHTPTARLAINYLLEPRPAFVAALNPAALPTLPPPPVPLVRPLGAALYVDRLTSGGIIGTRLEILDRPPTIWLAPLGPIGQPTIGKNLDLTA